ncbi:hypothetical protein HU200_034415 [Digitaria exilis]|uniref:Gnk2-homologous domain-containing protein n=1 Tax=Digitaria exilis TaxID=1010633 RepID=A0A835BVS8_9POAL|nr:hypothetical protein HU200_034415 [Digitaria exilis]
MAMATVVRLITGLLVLALLPPPPAGKAPWQRSPVKVFDAAVRVLLNATGDHAAAAANSTRRFDMGEEAFDASNPTIYGLTLCTPDMSPAECRSCLGDIT